MEALPKKLEEPGDGPSTSSEWPSLPISQVTNETSSPASSILSGQKPAVNSATPVSWSIKKKSAEDREKDKVRKYAPYFQGYQILPVPELVAPIEPKTLSFIMKDLRTRRLAGLQKEMLEELFKSTGPMPAFLPVVSTHGMFSNAVWPFATFLDPVTILGLERNCIGI